VVVAENGRNALFVARQERPDLILLDIMMPEMDGTDFLRTYRKEANTPVIMLTAKLEETDKVLELELGADDYITKPFGMRELLARVRAVLRRVESDKTDQELLQVADVELDLNGRRVTVSGVEVDLTPSEFDLLAILMANPGRAFTRLDLDEQLQGIALEGAEKTINVHIRNLRQKIETDPAQPRYVETVFGRRLYLPEINAKNGMRRQAAERTAINAPMQGTAADIIKRAMIRVHDWLPDAKLDAAMIMQVHDELVFEVDQADVDGLVKGVTGIMEGAAELAVPLTVDAGVGANWDEAH